MDDPLTWDDSYGIARALKNCFPQVDLEQVTLEQVYRWTLALPAFVDDPALSNDEILMSIYRDWFEEVNAI